jgi:hypothetical protein
VPFGGLISGFIVVVCSEKTEKEAESNIAPKTPQQILKSAK